MKGFADNQNEREISWLKILVVDDSSSHRAIAKLELEKGGYEIVEAVDSQDALDVLDKTPVIFVTGRDTLEEREKGG